VATIEKRVSERGDISYRVRIRLSGEKPRTRTFNRKTDAELWSKKVESDLGHGAYVPTTADRRRTLADLIDKFVKEQLPIRSNNADARNLDARLAWWKENAGFVTLDKLTPQAIAGYRSELLARKTGTGEREKPLTQATVNRYLAALSAVCKWAWKELHWLPANPVLSVSKGPEHTGIIRHLSDDERKALLDACRASDDPNIYCAVMLALATGARYSNIRELTWADVDLDRWTLRFTHTKNGQPRYVPVVGHAQHVLQAQFDKDPTQKSWVFKGYRDDAPADLDRPWRVVRAAAGLTGDKHCRFHDLRHTTASYLTMNGATLAEVAEALGHRTLVMAKRYSHQSGEHVRGTLERMANRFLNDPAGDDGAKGAAVGGSSATEASPQRSTRKNAPQVG
jgi:integrase